MKVIASLGTVIITLAVVATLEVADEDDNSPVVSYLLAKIQRLESKIMTKPKTREITKRSIDANVDKRSASCNCPPPVVAYNRWGNSSCPFGATTVYTGVAAGGDKDVHGSAVNMLCLPSNPIHYSNGASGIEYVFGVEYQTSGTLNHADARNMPCAMCEVTGKSTVMVIPSRYVCPNGWRLEYNGYIMVGDDSEEGSSMYDCIDVSLEQIPGTGSDQGWHHLWPVRLGSSSDSLPYDGSNAMTCAVCSK